MLTYEFETQARNGMIKIPDEYKEVIDGNLKIIILKQEQKSQIYWKKRSTNIKKLLKKIQEKNIFQTIDDPREWQRTIRDEWS